MDGKLLFLHLSDIHFSKSKIGEPYDLDNDLRHRLEADARIVANKLGPPNATLISGDVAFSGSRDEYEMAKAWLDEHLCVAINGDPASIWSVPGNHDVYQAIIKSRPTYADLRLKFRSEAVDQIDHLLNRHLSEPEVFYTPIEEYNNFALEFGCDIGIKRPVWDSGNEFSLNDGSILRLFGLNSTMISDHTDHIDTGKMVLGSHQCQIPVHPGVENVVICHHPFDWIRDGDLADEILNPRCFMQLVGHKHKHKLRQVDKSLLQVSAGAVHPSRNEPGWQPRYNWIQLCVTNENEMRQMRIEVFPRVWNPTKQAFDADYNNCEPGQISKVFFLDLPPLPPEFTESSTPAESPTKVDLSLKTSSEDPTVHDEENDSIEHSDSRGNPIMNPKRTLARRYFQLGYAKKMKIATELQLLDDSDGQLPDQERQKCQLRRAKEKGILGKLWDLVELAHNDGRYPHNPFN